MKTRRGKSKYLGVYQKGKKWAAWVQKNNKHTYIGVFGTEREAAEAHDKVAREIIGPLAHLNFPTPDEMGCRLNTIEKVIAAGGIHAPVYCCAARFGCCKFCRRLYHVWNDAKRRCTEEGHVAEKRYKNRGIKMCKSWMKSYARFRIWALKNGYSGFLKLDRINFDGNYSPQNCRFIGNCEQLWNVGKQQTFKGRPTTTKFRGVYYDKERQKYQARIWARGILYNLGRFDTANEAGRERDKWAKRLHGEYAFLNFP